MGGKVRESLNTLVFILCGPWTVIPNFIPISLSSHLVLDQSCGRIDWQTNTEKTLLKSTLMQQKNAKLYLILVLFSPLHLCWGIGQVFWTFIKLMFHGVDGMTTREKKEETVTLNIINVCSHMHASSCLIWNTLIIHWLALAAWECWMMLAFLFIVYVLHFLVVISFYNKTLSKQCRHQPFAP